MSVSYTHLDVYKRQAVNSGYGDKIVVMLHYPPMNDKHEASGFTELISQYRGIRKVVYGHLHGQESIVQRLSLIHIFLR